MKRARASYAATLLAAIALSAPVQAATGFWNTTDGNWDTTSNWWTTAAGTTTMASKPVAGDTVTFNGTGVNGAETIYLNGNQAAASLTFNNTGTTTILGGTSATPAVHTLTLSGGITVNAGAGAVTIGNTGGTAAANLALSASQAFLNKTTTVITVNSGITSSAATGTQILTLNSSGLNASNAGFTFNGVIGDGGSGGKLQIAINNSTPSSVYTFNQINTFSGGLRFGQAITGQTLIAGADNAFGTGLTQLGDGSGGGGVAQVQASGTARSFSNNWIVDTSGVGSNKMSFTGANGITISGTFNQNSRGFASSLSGGATLTLSGTVYISNTDVTGQTATLTGTGNTLISGVIQNNALGTNTNASDYTITNTGTTTLSAANTFSGVLTQSAAGTLTLKHQNAVQNATFTKTAGTLVFDSTVAGNAFTFGGLAGASNIALANNATTPAGIALTVGGNNAATTYSGVLSGAGSLTKTGTGTLTLSGANSYTGATTVSAGVLNIQNNTALGTVDAGTSVASGTALQLQGGITVGTEALTLSGTGIASDGALRNISGNNTYGGLITLGAATRINSDTGGTTLTLSNTGTITGATFGLTVGGAGDTSIAGILGMTSGGLTKDGAGTLTLSGANTYTGTTTLSAGTLKLVNQNAVQSSTLTLSGGSVVFDSTVGGNAFTAGGLAGSGNLALQNNAGSPNPIALTVGNGNNSASYSGVLSGAGSLVKTGNGTQTLTGNNGYTGATTVSAGVLNIQNATGLGTTAAGTSVTSGAALQLQGGITVGTEALTLAGSGVANDGALRSISGANTYGGLLTLAADSRINSDTSGVTLTLSNTGTITGAGFNLTVGGTGNTTIASIIGTTTGGLTKDGTGTLSLSGVNTFSGGLTIKAGTVSLGTTVAAGGSGTITIGDTGGSAAATLNLGGIGGASAIYTNAIALGTSSGPLTLSAATAISSVTGGVTGTNNLILANIRAGSGGSMTLATGNVDFTGTLTNGGALVSTLGTTTISAQITNKVTGVIQNSTASTLVLSGANTYTGPTTITTGILSVGTIGNGGVTGNLGAATSAAGNLVFDGGTLLYTGANATSDRAFTINAGKTATIDTTNNLSFAGATGAATTGALTKLGAGTLTLTGVQTNTGLTTVSAGALAIGSSGSLASGNALTLGVSGAADFANAGQTLGAVTNDNTTSNALNFSATGAGTVTLASLSGAGNTRFGSDGVVTGGISAGTVTSVGNLTANISGGTTTVGGLLTGNISSGTVGAGSLSATTVSGGTNTITGAAGITTLSNGTTTVGGVATIGTLSNGTANLNGATSAISTLNGGTVNLGSSTALTVSAGTYAGGIAGSGGSLTKAGGTTLTLTGANTYTGATTVSAGVLNVQHADALGATDAGTSVAAGAALQLQGGITVGAEALTLSGTGVSNAGGALRNISETNTYGGLLTLGADTRINSDAGSLVLSNTGTITGATFGLTIGGAGDTTLAGVIGTTTGTLTKDGIGTLTLSGVNTYTGVTTINGGTLMFSGSGSTPSTNSVVVNNGGTLTFGRRDTWGNDATSTSAQVTINSGGTLSSGGQFTTLWNLALNDASVRLNGGFSGAFPAFQWAGTLTATGTSSVTVVSGNDNMINLGGFGLETLTVQVTGDSDQLTINTPLQNKNAAASALTKTGTGTLTLTAANTYTGATTVSAGVLNIQNAAGLGTTAAGTSVGSGAALQLQGGISVGAEALTLSGTGVGNAGGALRNLSGNNTYGGLITLGAATRINSDTGGTTLTLSNTGTITGATFGLTVGGAGDTSIAGILGMTSGGLTKDGAGTLTLSGANTYTGTTTLSAGTLKLVNQNAVQSSTLTLSGGSVVFDSTVGGNAFTAGGLAGSGNLALQNNAGSPNPIALTVGNGNNSASYSGVLSGAGSLVKTGNGTQTLTGNNNYTGATTVSAGVLNIQNATGLGTTAAGTTVADGAALQVQGDITVGAEALTLNGTGVGNAGGALRSISGANTFGGDITLASASRINADADTLTLSNTGTLTGSGVDLTLGGAGDIEVNRIIATGAGNLIKDGAGTVTLSAVNTFTGTTTINGGTLKLGVANALSSSSSIFLADVAGVVLDLNNFTNVSLGSISGGGSNGGSISLGSTTLTVGADNTSTTYSSNITGGGGLTKIGNGIFTLAGSNGYTGATRVSGGTLKAGSTSAFGAGSAVTLDDTSGVTLDLNNLNITLGSLAGGGTSGGNITLGSGTLTTGGNNASTVYGGVISGSGGFAKTGTGTLTLTGTHTYIGATSLASGGSLQIGNGTTDGSIATSSAITNNGALIFNLVGSQTNAMVISGSGTLAQIGTGTLTLTGVNTYIGATTIASGGTLQIGDGTTDGSIAASSGITNNGALLFNLAGNQTNAMAIDGTGSLTKSGAGTLTLTGTNNYAGATTVSAGTLAFNAAAALGATSAINLADTTTLTYTGGTTTFNRNLAVAGGTGTLRNSGGGTLTLSGTLTKNATTLKFAQGLFDVTGTIAGASANSDLVVDNASVTLSGVNTYNGPTFLRNGATLTAAVAGALPTATRSALTLDDSGTGSSTFALGADQVAASLAGATTSTVSLGTHALTVGTTGGSTTFGGTLSGTGTGGGLTKDGTSTLILAGSSTYTGATTISAGTLQAGATNALSAASAVTLANTAGANLALNNFSQTIGSLAGGGTTGGTVSLGSATLTTGGLGTSTSYTGVISGSGGLTKTGAGTFTLTGVNTFGGTTTVSAGTLTLNSSGVALTNTSGLSIASTGTVSLGAANQIKATANLTLNGGTLALNGFDQTLGTLDLNANSTLNFGGSSQLVFADSSAFDWNSATLSVIDFHSGTSSLRFGTSSGGLTATQLGLIRFYDFGNVAGQIDANGYLAPLSSNYNNSGSTDLLLDNAITGTTTVTQSGTASTTLTGANTSTGLASVTSGTLVIGTVAGGNWAGNVTVSGTGTLKGRGDITGDVIVDSGGNYSPGNSPAIQNIGSLTVNAGGLVTIELDGATAGNGAGFHDKVVSAGAVTLNGGTLSAATIFAGSSTPAYVPDFGASHTIITGSAITGTFAAYNFAAGANAAGVTWLPEYTATAVNLFAVPDNYATLAGLSPNQTRLGAALQSLRPAQIDNRAALSSTGTLFNRLMRQDAAGLRSAYDQLTPEKLTALAAGTFQSASLLNSSLLSRSAELRRVGPASISLNGAAVAAPEAEFTMETVIEDGVHYQIAKAKPKKRVGYFAGASGAFAAVDGSANRLGSFSQTGAGYGGLDYTVNENQSVGLVVSQSLADTDFAGAGGSARTTTSRVGVFHDYHRDGFYLNSSASFGSSFYESKRQIGFLSQTASGETQGLSYGGQLATGYDFKVGDFIIGPTASLAYDHARIDSFGETGSAAAFNVGRQSADSLVTALGVRVSRPFAWNRLGWIPEVNLGVSRQHFNPNAVTARFAAGGDAFKVQPQDGGGEFINPGVGLTVVGGQGWSVRLGYSAILSPASAEHRVDLSLNAGF